jgi:hypothetical protein
MSSIGRFQFFIFSFKHRAILVFHFWIAGDSSFSISNLTRLIGHYHPCCILENQFHQPHCDPTHPKNILAVFLKILTQLAWFMLVKNVGTILAENSKKIFSKSS